MSACGSGWVCVCVCVCEQAVFVVLCVYARVQVGGRAMGAVFAVDSVVAVVGCVGVTRRVCLISAVCAVLLTGS